MSHDGSSCKSYIKHPTEKERLDNLAFTTFPEDYLPYTSSYHRKAPYLVWDDGFRPHRKRRLKRWRQSSSCRCCTTAALVTAISVIVVGILSIVAVSIYLGVVTNLFRSPILSLSGKVSVTEGDGFSDHLLNTSSYQFLAKAETYQAMLENVYLSSSLEAAFVGAKVYAFRKGDDGLLVFFRIYLDRRKLLQSDKDILVTAKDIITDEATANKLIFNNLNIDPFSVEFKEYDEQWLPTSEFDFQKQTTVAEGRDEEENLLFTSYSHAKESSTLLTAVDDALQLSSTKGFNQNKDEELYSTVVSERIKAHNNMIPFESTLVSNIVTESVHAVNIDEKIDHSQWQPLLPSKIPQTDVAVGEQSSRGDSQTPGRGSVRLIEDIPHNLHSFPVVRIPHTDSSHDLKPQSNVASSIMSSVSLVILPSSKNHTVTLSNKNRLNKNAIATVVKPGGVETDSTSHVNNNNSETEIANLNSDVADLVNGTDMGLSDIRRNHASFRYIDHLLKEIGITQHASSDGSPSFDISWEQNLNTSVSETAMHPIPLTSKEVIGIDRNTKFLPHQEYNNEALNHKYADEVYFNTSVLGEGNETDSVVTTDSSMQSQYSTEENDSFPETLDKNEDETKTFYPWEQNISKTITPFHGSVHSTIFPESFKAEVDVYENSTDNSLDNGSLNGDEKVDFQLENSDLREPVIGDIKINSGGNDEESSDYANEGTTSSNLNYSSNDLLDLPTSTVNVPSTSLDMVQTGHPSEGSEFYHELRPVVNDYESFSTLPNKVLLQPPVKETTSKYVDVSSVTHDTTETVGFTTGSYTTTEKTRNEANITTFEKSEYVSNQSNTNDSLEISLGQNNKFGDGLVGLPKIVPPFSDTQFNPNDINSEPEMKNDNTFLDEAKFVPVTTLSVLDVVALTLNPTAEVSEGFTNIPDDQNVFVQHITTPQPVPQNDPSVTSLGKYPTHLFGRCSEDEILCHSGECVPANYRCNMRRDCRDNSDEENCSCTERLKVIGQSQKICDGVQDCWDFSDEEHCPWCSSGQFICPQSRACINMTQVCDGNNDCPYGIDEKYCVKLAEDEITASGTEYKNKGYLMIRKQGQWGKLCLENLRNLAHTDTLKWKIEELGKAVCTALSYKEFKEAKQVEDENKMNESYYEISAEIVNRQNRRSNAVFHPSECQSKDVVHVTCKSLECGMRPMAFSLRQRIVGGQSTTSGSWPWQVALYKEGDFQCGAVVVSESWLISAGHCFYSTQTSHWTARLGLLRRGTELPSPSEQVRKITHIFLHPGYVDKGFINDIALLRLEMPVPFSDYLRPLCLPNATEDVSMWNSQQCSVIGWGKLFEVGHTFPDSLQEVRLPVISTEECRKKILFLSMYHITDNMFCAGYERGGRDACLGDSGGPLMCQRADGRWVLLGVTSNGDGCGRPGRPGVYTKVTKYLSWIQQTMDAVLPPAYSTLCSGHRCPLGRCVPEQKVCDGRWDCSDGSDETSCLVK